MSTSASGCVQIFPLGNVYSHINRRLTAPQRFLSARRILARRLHSCWEIKFPSWNWHAYMSLTSSNQLLLAVTVISRFLAVRVFQRAHVYLPLSNCLTSKLGAKPHVAI